MIKSFFLSFSEWNATFNVTFNATFNTAFHFHSIQTFISFNISLNEIQLPQVQVNLLRLLILLLLLLLYYYYYSFKSNYYSNSLHQSIALHLRNSIQLIVCFKIQMEKVQFKYKKSQNYYLFTSLQMQKKLSNQK